MIKEFVERFDRNRGKLLGGFKTAHPENYLEIVKRVVEVIVDDDEYCSPDPDRIHQIDDGDYQGTLVFVIAAKGYQPSDYWYVKVGYGSCSGCDTLQDISSYSFEPPTDEQANEYLTLALHVLQGIKKMGDEE